MEAADFFEILLAIYQTAWHHVPEDTNLTLDSHRRETLKSRSDEQLLASEAELLSVGVSQCVHPCRWTPHFRPKRHGVLWEDIKVSEE
jgi:hypothetical protein